MHFFDVFVSLGIFLKKIEAFIILRLFSFLNIFLLKLFGWKLLLYILPNLFFINLFFLREKGPFSSLCKIFLFSFFLFFSPFSFEFFSCVFRFFFRKNRSVRMEDGLMQRMSRGRGQCQLNVHGLSSLNNVTARSSDEESFQSRKQSSTHEKKVFFLGNKTRFVFQIFSTRHWWRWWRSPRPRRRW